MTGALLELPPGSAGKGSAREAFDGAVLPHLRSMAALACGILGSEDLAWDAVQETLLTLWRQGQLPPNPRAWLLRAVTHRCVHLLRTRSRRRKHEERAAAGRVECCACDDPAQVAMHREWCSHLENALGQLPPEQRQILLLRGMEQMDYDDIALALRLPVGTVRSRLSRARAALREALQEKLE